MNWITSGKVNDRHNLLPPELFRKTLTVCGPLVSAHLKVSSMGIYEANINGEKVSDCYFAPGYTHYESYVQVQTYDVTALLHDGDNVLDIIVANGWWLGTLGSKNNRYGKMRALAAELTLHYAAGTTEIIQTDESWTVTQDTPFRYADFYNGEEIDLTRENETAWRFTPAKSFCGKTPALEPHLGAFVREDCRLAPVSVHGDIYDFGQNHAGVLNLIVEAEAGAVITVRHGEILDACGGLFTKNLRKAKATLTLSCKAGTNVFTPCFTYMGFRYAEITCTTPVRMKRVESIVLTSDCTQIGQFSCSDALINRLQSNIQWGQCSNFVDIPTDCPQRDERMGWTGDIAVFAQTAAFNRDISVFMRKWLKDLRLFQSKNGALPVTVPANKTYEPFPYAQPTAIWGDAATMVPWAVYLAYGDREMLQSQYDSMKAYVEAELRIANRLSLLGHKKFLWDNNPFQYGDWCAPGEGFSKWTQKGKYLSTSFMANSVNILCQSARALGRQEDEERYSEMLRNIQKAYERYCILPDGRLKGDFQSNYACALYFNLIPDGKKAGAARRLAMLVRENDYRIATGFAGTPYILFALADNGYVEDAYRLLQNEKCPGWLYTVKAGGTTTWERWDALAEDGSIRADAIPDMISFNHYAYGAVGDFFYRRILGIEASAPGYKRFTVKPIPGGTLTYAEGSLKSRYGTVSVKWERDETFTLYLTVPEGTVCDVVLPNGETNSVSYGSYVFTVN